jgi:hypothetical protein
MMSDKYTLYTKVVAPDTIYKILVLNFLFKVVHIFKKLK